MAKMPTTIKIKLDSRSILRIVDVLQALVELVPDWQKCEASEIVQEYIDGMNEEIFFE